MLVPARALPMASERSLQIRHAACPPAAVADQGGAALRQGKLCSRSAAARPVVCGNLLAALHAVEHRAFCELRGAGARSHSDACAVSGFAKGLASLVMLVPFSACHYAQAESAGSLVGFARTPFEFVDAMLKRVYSIERRGGLLLAGGHQGRCAMFPVSAEPSCSSAASGGASPAPLLSWKAHDGRAAHISRLQARRSPPADLLLSLPLHAVPIGCGICVPAPSRSESWSEASRPSGAAQQRGSTCCSAEQCLPLRSWIASVAFPGADPTGAVGVPIISASNDGCVALWDAAQSAPSGKGGVDRAPRLVAKARPLAAAVNQPPSLTLHRQTCERGTNGGHT